GPAPDVGGAVLQVRQAVAQKTDADSAVTARLPEAYQWLLSPTQSSPQAPLQWQAIRLSGQESLAERASKKLRNEELLVTVFASSRLRMELDRVPLWRGEHVKISQIIEDFARYNYLPRLKNSTVVMQAIADGIGLLTWMMDSFAYADGYDQKAERYQGLRGGERISVSEEGLLVKPDIAQRQIEKETRKPEKQEELTNPPSETKLKEPSGKTPETEQTPVPPPAPKPKRFHGSVILDTERVGRDASKVAEEVIAHLSVLPESKVKVTLEIEAILPEGAPENVVRTVTENCQTLRFETQGFEKD
ncbi:MAG TPA: AAA+ family ATPase, partial [bacterium]|nr:AAA+ family ATPase [bacterium]